MNWNHEAHTDLALALSEVGNLEDCLTFLSFDSAKIPPSLLRAKFAAEKFLNADYKNKHLAATEHSKPC